MLFRTTDPQSVILYFKIPKFQFTVLYFYYLVYNEIYL